MAYTDFAFYGSGYFGDTLTEETSPKWLERASDELDAITFGRLTFAFPTVEAHAAKVKKARTDPEPLPATSPLWDAPNMLITPHISGWFHLEATLNNVVDIAAENLRHLQAGETLRRWIEH